MALVKKKFHAVEIPVLKREIELYSFGEDELIGKRIKIDLTNTLKGKALEIKFIIQKEKDNIFASPLEAFLMPSYIRRTMRKGTDYVEDSFITKCKDYRIRIKPFIITRKRVSKAVLNGLREKSKEIIIDYVKTKTFETLISELMNGNLQKNIQPKLKKIYPLGLCEIRFLGIEELNEYEKNSQKALKEKIKEEQIQVV